jgi:hypothetical protein
MDVLESFFVKANEIETADIRSVQILISGESISIGRSQGLLSDFVGNVILEILFLGCSNSEILMNLSELMIERRLELESADFSILSVEPLDYLLFSESISVEIEDELLRRIVRVWSAAPVHSYSQAYQLFPTISTNSMNGVG